MRRMDKKCDENEPERLPLDFIQPQEEKQEKPKPRPRPMSDCSERDKVKKKRKLLSFDEEDDGAEKDKIVKSNLVKKEINRKELTAANIKQIQGQLKSEFANKKSKLDEETFEFDYSYWDGGEVIKKLKRKKKEKIEDLIEVCRLQLISNFQSLATLRANDLLMVIKDFIAPHNMTISQIQLLELKTSKGVNLFNFKNVKIKEFSLSVNMEAPIRIVERDRYEKNINNYPFSTWHTMKID